MGSLMIISFLCIIFTTILLLLSGIQGYYQVQIVQANHPQFALLTTIFYMFTETLIMFYFIGTGTAIKKTIQMSCLDTSLYDNIIKTKMKLFPHLTLNMVLVGIVFILGGAVQTGRISGWIHGMLFNLTFLHFMYTTLLQHNGFKENVAIISELANYTIAKVNGASV